MSKKMHTSTYIAIDTYVEAVIHIGSLDQVAEAISEHCEHHGWDADDAENAIKVRELGDEVNVSFRTQVVATF